MKIVKSAKMLFMIPLLLIATLLTPSVTATAPVNFGTSLIGGEEVPPVATSGTGSFSASLNAAHNMLSFNLAVSGFPNLTKITASHIHVGAFGVNGPIILFLFNRATEGAFPGAKTGTLTPANLIPRPAQGVNNFTDAINKMLTGQTYANVHTEANPGGEIRGQIEVVVEIDIKPGSDPNSINVKCQGVIPVAILTAGHLDAATVDPSTVRFGRTGTEATPVRSSLEDVDGDGDLDLVLHFNCQDTGFMAGDTQGVLTARTFDGGLITGTDSVRAFFPGDVDGNLRVDILDLALAAFAFGSSPESSRWNLNADFDENAKIDILDVALVAFNFGERA